MKVIRLRDEAEKLALSTGIVRHHFEDELIKGRILGIISPDSSEVICFDKDEIENLISELLGGKVSLAYLAQQIGLTDYQVYLVLQNLLKSNRIDGELTYNTFVSNTTTKKLLLQKAKTQKRNHRHKMMSKHR